MHDERVLFRKRFLIALILSIAAHVLCLTYAAYRVAHYEIPMRPLIITVNTAPPAPSAPLDAPVPPPEPKSPVDAAQPANQPVKPTDLIAEQDSNARDMNPSNEVSASNAPSVDVVDEFDELNTAPAPKSPPHAEQKAKSPRTKKDAPKKKKTMVAQVERPPVNEPPPAESDSQQRDEGNAGNETPLPAADAEGKPSRGRVDGNVRNLGFLGFEAIRSEVAPYLKEVRKRVERQWHAALQMRYSGTTPTRAVIQCAIAPDGRLIQADIVEAGDSPTYAALCKQAIKNAAPFPAFPFQVPEMYRSKDLEIRWTFDFLK
jgi:protein TonB